MELPSEESTEALGAALGRRLGPGAVVLLSGDLGAGKTVVARGIALGLGVPDKYAIVSPTFTLLNVYPGDLEFFHADLYRLTAAQAAELELLEEAAQGVLAVEWAERAPELWPSDCFHLELRVLGPDKRQARLRGQGEIVQAVTRELAGG
jgi:tRNA threonylcarbamoyl adenosine modification protein YjeE